MHFSDKVLYLAIFGIFGDGTDRFAHTEWQGHPRLQVIGVLRVKHKFSAFVICVLRFTRGHQLVLSAEVKPLVFSAQ